MPKNFPCLHGRNFTKYGIFCLYMKNIIKAKTVDKKLAKTNQEKKMDLASFIKLAERVRLSFEEQRKYLEQEQQRHQTPSPARFL